MKRKVIVPLNPEWLAHAMRLPADMEIDDVRYDFERGSVLVKLKSERFAEVGEAQPIPYAQMMMTPDGTTLLHMPDGDTFMLDGAGGGTTA